MSSDKDVFDFPCEFPIKAFGFAEEGFPGLVMDIIRCHAPETQDDAMEVRQSKAGKYYSVTIRITARNREQLDAIYQLLTDHEKVIMAL